MASEIRRGDGPCARGEKMLQSGMMGYLSKNPLLPRRRAMRCWAGRCIGPGLIAMLVLWGLGRSVQAQTNIPLPPGMAQHSGMILPRFPAQGGWAEVLTVKGNWAVLMNEEGQQFPVSRDMISLFVIRWPTSPNRIPANSLIEAHGIDMSTNAVQTNHVDVYAGAAMNLVSPMAARGMGSGRMLTPFDTWTQTRYGFNYLKMMSPQEAILPIQLHIVGPLLNRSPLEIAMPGNSFMRVLPAPLGMSMSQVTLGTFGLLRPGDLAYVIPRKGMETTGSLNLAQFVVYKAMPLDQFR